MAGDWLPMRLDLGDDPAVLSVAATLKTSPQHVVGMLHAVWSWANRNTRTGNLPATADVVDRIAGVDGFANALACAGWLMLDDDEVKIPHFERWNLAGAKRRLANTLRQQKLRDTLGRDRSATEARQERDKSATKARLEKRREEESREETKSVLSHARSSGSNGEVEAIYAAYPRHCGRKTAIAKIEIALREISSRRPDAATWLLGRVTAFARSPAGRAGKFTPHPATWFNQGRYDDDDAAWQREAPKEIPPVIGFPPDVMAAMRKRGEL